MNGGWKLSLRWCARLATALLPASDVCIMVGAFAVLGRGRELGDPRSNTHNMQIGVCAPGKGGGVIGQHLAASLACNSPRDES